jgi:hypothetical protein
MIPPMKIIPVLVILLPINEIVSAFSNSKREEISWDVSSKQQLANSYRQKSSGFVIGLTSLDTVES